MTCLSDSRESLRFLWERDFSVLRGKTKLRFVLDFLNLESTSFLNSWTYCLISSEFLDEEADWEVVLLGDLEEEVFCIYIWVN